MSHDIAAFAGKISNAIQVSQNRWAIWDYFGLKKVTKTEVLPEKNSFELYLGSIRFSKLEFRVFLSDTGVAIALEIVQWKYRWNKYN